MYKDQFWGVKKKEPCARQADSFLLWRHADEQSLASGAAPQGTVRQSALGGGKKESLRL